MPRHAVDQQLATVVAGALAHAHHAIAVRVCEGVALGTGAIVAHFEVQHRLRRAVHVQTNPDRLCFGMPRHIAEHLLEDAEHRDHPALAEHPRRWQHTGRHVHLHVVAQLGGLDELLRLPFQRSPQALVVEDARAQVGDDAAEVVDRRVDQPAHALAFVLQRGPVFDTLLEPVHVHLQRHEQRAELVVNVARDARAFVFAHGL